MKRMKKLLAVMLAAVMVMGMTTSVFAATYTVTIDSSITNGSVSVVGGTSASVSVDEGNTVTLTVTPASGYELDTLTVTEETSGDTVTITQDTSDSSKYTFTMPADNVTVTATFAKTYTITIENSTEDYTYVVYQIFTGDLSTDGKTLSNIEWGSDITADGISALKTYYSLGADATASDVATAIVSADDAQAPAEELKSDSSCLTGGTTMNYDSSAGTYSASGLSAGYYLVVNTDVPSTGTGIAYSNYIVELLVDVTMSPKSDVPSVTKTVTDTSGNESDVTSASAGESVSFTLTATMPSNYADYDAYKLVFHDTLSTGLTYNDDVTVTVNTYVPDSTLTTFDSDTTYYTYDSTNGYVEVDTSNGATPVTGTTYYTYVTTEVKSGATITPTYTQATGLTAFESGVTYYTYNDQTQEYTVVSNTDTFVSGTAYYYVSSFTVTMADTNALKDKDSNTITVNASSTIVVTYTATVNSKITAGTAETNKVYLEYSNNPTEEYDPTTSGSGDPSTGTTTEVITYVYTFDLSVTKTDDAGDPLSGAKFSLYKKVTLTETEFDSNNSGAYYTISGTTATVADSTYDADATYYVLVEKDIEAADDGNGAYIATFNDLGEGTYALVESETPSGYNTIDAVYFVIVATYDANGDVDTLEIQDTDGNPISNNVTGATFSTVSTTGAISTTIENVSGAALPTTGGIGTTMFYVVGMILVLGAAVMLVTRRRMAR